jgi:phytanoyl-CoA hydroxylase
MEGTGVAGLTSGQVRFFRHCGYLRLPGVLDDDLIGRLAGVVAADFAQVPAGSRPEKAYHLYERHQSQMDALISHPVLVEPLRALLGQHFVFVTNRHNCGILHPTGAGPSARLHRDVLQWSRPLLTALVYLEESTVESGCTEVVPGSHFASFVETSTTGGTWMDEHDEHAYLGDQAVPVPMRRGSVLVMDATLFHAAGRNRGPGTRMSIALAYRSVDELDAHSRDQRTVLVSGEFVYRGNDLN